MGIGSGQISREMDLIQRTSGGWLAVSKDRALAVTGNTEREAAEGLAGMISRFDDWARRWEEGRKTIPSPHGKQTHGTGGAPTPTLPTSLSR